MNATSQWNRIGNTWALESENGQRRVVVEMIPAEGRFSGDVQIRNASGEWVVLWSQRGLNGCPNPSAHIIDQHLRYWATEIDHDATPMQRYMGSDPEAAYREPYCPRCGGCDAHSPDCRYAYTGGPR